MTKPDDCAFSTNPIYGTDDDVKIVDFEPGLSIREYMATQAMQGILANLTWNAAALATAGLGEREAIAAAGHMAVLYADSLIASLNEKVGAAPKGESREN